DAQCSTGSACAGWCKGRVESHALIGGEGHRQIQSADGETGPARRRLRDRYGGAARVGQRLGLTVVASHLNTPECQAGRIGRECSGSNSVTREGNYRAVYLACGGSKRDAAAEISASGGRERDRRRSCVPGVQRKREGEVAHRKSCAAQRRLGDGEIGPAAVRKSHSAGLVGPNFDVPKGNLRGTG